MTAKRSFSQQQDASRRWATRNTGGLQGRLQCRLQYRRLSSQLRCL